MSDPDGLTFQQSLVELERLVHQLEDGQTGLEEALACYERGVGLLKQCYAQLRQAEQRILLLTGVDEHGEPILQPFEHTATADLIRPADTRRRRKKPSGPEIPYEQGGET
jgi:exodeoxyribonuclease VII small subunit